MSGKYFVTVKDYYGQETVVEVSREIWEVFEDDRLLNERMRGEYHRHGDKRGVENTYLETNPTPFLIRWRTSICAGKCYGQSMRFYRPVCLSNRNVFT